MGNTGGRRGGEGDFGDADGLKPSAEEGGQVGLDEGEEGGESDIERVARGEGECEECCGGRDWREKEGL